MTVPFAAVSPGQPVILAADHAGYDLKQAIKEFLTSHQIAVEDVGCFSANTAVDYPRIGETAIHAMPQHPEAKAILVCGSGVGVCIAANRFAHIRAVLAHDVHLARMSRLHNNANVLCLGGRFVAPALAETIVETWLSTLYEGERHEARVSMLQNLNTSVGQPMGC
ncbi:MAG: ribose 5-phosphate isomerase B [Candidatus Melainabacteria bacterium]|nr:ribose 5-phosphate isomerase B [Candidatus Melainabacteria bacterium]